MVWFHIGEDFHQSAWLEVWGPMKPFLGDVTSMCNFLTRGLLVSFSGAHNLLHSLYFKISSAASANHSALHYSQWLPDIYSMLAHIPKSVETETSPLGSPPKKLTCRIYIYSTLFPSSQGREAVSWVPSPYHTEPCWPSHHFRLSGVTASCPCSPLLSGASQVPNYAISAPSQVGQKPVPQAPF